jgi:hypothetical protein
MRARPEYLQELTTDRTTRFNEEAGQQPAEGRPHLEQDRCPASPERPRGRLVRSGPRPRDRRAGGKDTPHDHRTEGPGGGRAVPSRGTRGGIR